MGEKKVQAKPSTVVGTFDKQEIMKSYRQLTMIEWLSLAGFLIGLVISLLIKPSFAVFTYPLTVGCFGIMLGYRFGWYKWAISLIAIVAIPVLGLALFHVTVVSIILMIVSVVVFVVCVLVGNKAYQQALNAVVQSFIPR